jgi:hypothetical protein
MLAVAVLAFVAPLRAAGPAPGVASPAAGGTPERKAAEAARIDALYRRKKAALPPERQAWETVLEQNLGNAFYLPIHKRDFVQGVSTAWDFVVDDPQLPRVLLIGDSVSRGYTLPVRAALSGRANVHRAPENCGPTANGLKKLGVWLGDGRWDAIVFNFGIHDRNTPGADYEARLEEIARRLLRTGARLIWASSTPLPKNGTYGSDAAIVARNGIAARVMRRHGIAIVDLHTQVAPRLAELQKPKDVHFAPEGYTFLGQRVAEEIARAFAAIRP